MKKTYMTPRSLAAELNVENLLCASPSFGMHDEQADQWSNKHEGGWSSDSWTATEEED